MTTPTPNKGGGCPFYEDICGETDIFFNAYKAQLPVMLKGPTGCGKSRFVENMAYRLNKDLIQIACNEETSSVDLLGRYIVKGGDTIWQDGPVTRAVKKNCILYLDEISEAREDVIVVLHPLSDYRREIYVDKICEKIKAEKDFMLVVSFNPGYQKGFKELKNSTKQRFVGISFNYPSENKEIFIIVKESGVDEKIAKNLVLYANKVRKLTELELSETISTRLLINAGKLIVFGMNKKIACISSIIQPLSDDKDVNESLLDILNLYF
ncbi:MAG: CbbQ/NirQ/NorQ/GpvN family protein [Candidatus Azosocius agrarius]|nr:MAG: CbbQ/NirQ/NorQ/GpvN family protein [Gammaproteobacteria bacterium]